ncbi:hypothetical protein AK830_g2022 [Neonectria ditissima]|uniref:Uncharacterized protein n=1 Tax=Neonectria ditissima TaxID=78410 RepID=A0A0P7BXE0_9HYPO|nr:hypothetical protein AK830_g2022 [Neonectria ditissima]
MKTLSNDELAALAGEYFAPTGLYQHTKSLPFLGTLQCNVDALTAGQWTEVIVEYTVGASGLADGAWIKGTFKFYSDWALFQTSDPTQDNYVSAQYVPGELHPHQTAATVQSLAVRFDQKGHERPFQKAIIIDVVDGYMNPGDKIVVRLGDRRWGSRGTRIQTFVEENFLMRWYIDPVGTSRFAPIKPDIALSIKPGVIAKVKAISPRVVRPDVSFPIYIHTEDAWGNATTDIKGLQAQISIARQGSGQPDWEDQVLFSNQGWTVANTTTALSNDGDFVLSVSVFDQEGVAIRTTVDHITVDASLPVPRILFADLHVHSDDTVGTNSTSYNFSYAQKVAGLDIVGYTANDFNITAERWDKTLGIINDINVSGEFVVFPGTEWCGNSAAGGDHNVVFLDDPSINKPEFPHDRNGNVARSFEWNEHGPAELTPGAWPLDEVYATYAHAPESHLLIPHVGGRRCNLAWHHPKLERLLEIGSAWGLFEWLLRDAVKRGWKLGVSANSDEHRGRCGGGVPGTAVFGTKGGLTGVLSDSLERADVAKTLRARRTFATTGERLVGIASAKDGKLQGDDLIAAAGETVTLNYRFYGSSGFSSIEAWDASGQIFHRNLQQEAADVAPASTPKKLRVKWGGARLYDRYREAVWRGSILVSDATIAHIQPFGGVLDNPEEVVELRSDTQVIFNTHTSGDFDGVDIFLQPDSELPSSVNVSGLLGGYVKVGNVLAGNPHKAQPEFDLVVNTSEASRIGGKQLSIKGGVDLFISVEILADVPLPKRVEGEFAATSSRSGSAENQAVYFVGREFSGGKVITSPTGSTAEMHYQYENPTLPPAATVASRSAPGCGCYYWAIQRRRCGFHYACHSDSRTVLFCMMAGRQTSHDDNDDTRSPHSSKRQKRLPDDQQNEVHEPNMQSRPLPPHDQYTIAWICALHIEMAAAHAMLDSIHGALPTLAGDSNTYTLGSIKEHNVVIACLPEGQYGTNNAANVLTNLKRSFPSIRAGLMVGIGGGVPGKVDIRLGDIVVGSRVMQYDLGKIVGDGQIQRTAVPKIPHQLLGTAVASLRATHERTGSQVPSILRERFKGSQYGRPASQDCLFCATYDHASQTANCDECDHSKLVFRSARMTNDPRIHYGAIASGNQVMRSGSVRDAIASQLGVICFEMEAAGLMDILPCLPIRGICDYSDSHKNKEWQRYSAAAAAAYARELLEVIPVEKGRAKAISVSGRGKSALRLLATRFDNRGSQTIDQDLPNTHRIRLMQSLGFDEMRSRKSAIKTAYRKTCQWLLDHPDYQAWLDSGKLTQHHGFLWISGKPGAGKSTIMKFACLKMERSAHGKDCIIAAFFFNARGALLERSIMGMYRSLLFQLLEGFPDLQTVLDDPSLVSQGAEDRPCLSLDDVKDLLQNAVLALGQRALTCFIDALDECDEEEVTDMVQYFEDLAEQATESCIDFRICFSSRHYPHITIRRGIRLTLESQPGHAEDLKSYVESHLRIEEPALLEELQIQLLNKGAGVFLWVVLVVVILNKENARGGLALRRRLAEIPNDLSKLFRDILSRDKENMEEFLLCILWILYAERPLEPMEYYHALWSGLSLKGLVDPEIPDLTGQDTSDKVDRCVIGSSKGLAEVTKTGLPTVQFIHESVRDFLVKDHGLQELWPNLGFDWKSLSHERLKQCCVSYMNHPVVHASLSSALAIKSLPQQLEISKKYPFLEYANRHILYHANAAASVVPQDEFLSHFDISRWITITKSLVSLISHGRHIRSFINLPNTTSLFYLLTEKGFSELIRTRLKVDTDIHCLGGRLGYPLFAALAYGNEDTVAALLSCPPSISNSMEVAEGLSYGRDQDLMQRTPLSWAAQEGHIAIVDWLVRTGASVNSTDGGGRTPLSRASELGHEAVARYLIQNGADINADISKPVSRDVMNSGETVAGLLMKEGANGCLSRDSGRTPFSNTRIHRFEAVVGHFIENRAKLSTRVDSRQTPLFWAASRGREEVARLLIETGADLDVSDAKGWTPLFWASRLGFKTIVTLLIGKGANVNYRDCSGRTPLAWAMINGHNAVKASLIDYTSERARTAGI